MTKKTKTKAQKPVRVAKPRVEESLRQQIAELDEALAINSKSHEHTREALINAQRQAGTRQTLIDIAVERAAQRANAAIVEYDAARVDLTRLTGDPRFVLGKTLPLIQLPRTNYTECYEPNRSESPGR